MNLSAFFPKWMTSNLLFNIPVLNWMTATLSALGIFLTTLIVLKFTISHLKSKADNKSEKFSSVLIELLSATNLFLIAVVSLSTGVVLLDLPSRLLFFAAHLMFIAVALQSGFWLNRVVTIWKRDYLVKRSVTNIAMASLLTSFVHGMVWIVVILAIFENAGINITTLVASLGVGGVAIALAAQTILGDLFAAIAIAVDKPFQVGDFITAGDISGNVERIGLKSTHIRSINGEQIVCSNMDLLKRTIQNFKRMMERRVVFRFNLSYRTPAHIAEKIPFAIKEIIREIDGVRLGRAHFVKLGNAALEFEAVYNVLDADYEHYMDIQQGINLSILKKLADLGADIALPDGTQATFLSEHLPVPLISETNGPGPIRYQ